MKTTHKMKVRIAKSLPRTAEDDKYNRGKFETEGWDARKAGIQARIARKQGATHERALARKAAAKKAVGLKATPKTIWPLRKINGFARRMAAKAGVR